MTGWPLFRPAEGSEAIGIRRAVKQARQWQIDRNGCDSLPRLERLQALLFQAIVSETMIEPDAAFIRFVRAPFAKVTRAARRPLRS